MCFLCALNGPETFVVLESRPGTRLTLRLKGRSGLLPPCPPGPFVCPSWAQRRHSGWDMCHFNTLPLVSFKTGWFQLVLKLHTFLMPAG